MHPRRSTVVKSLQQLLADFQVYYTNLRGFHWNIQGPDFFVLHSKFEDLYNDAAEKIDEIAERILTLGGVPANKFSDYLKISKIKEVGEVNCGSEALKRIPDSYKYLIGEERTILSLASEAGEWSDRGAVKRLPQGTRKTGLDALRLFDQIGITP